MMQRRLNHVASIAAILFGAAIANAQDMPLSQVLIEGEGWQRVSSGHAFTDGCAADAYGNFYFSDVARGESILKVSMDGKVSTFVPKAPKISAMQFGPDGRLYACQVGKFARIVAFDREGRASVIANDVKPNDLVVTHEGEIYFTETSKQQVTHIPKGGEPRSAATGVSKPNGIALTPGQGTLVASNVGKAADVADDFAKRIGALPGRGERADAAGTDPANRSALRLVDQIVILTDLGNDFIKQESSVLIAKAVVFETAISSTLRAWTSWGNDAGIDKDADGDRHLALVNQVVEDRGNSAMSF